MADPGAERIRAAGTLLWRDGDAGTEVAVIHRPRYDDWTFPKGKLDPGEHVLRAAVRETIEETGVVPRLGRRLEPSFYLDRKDRPKRVDWWAGEAVSAAEFVPNDEVDELVWLSPAAAEGVMSSDNEVILLHEFRAGPLVTRPLVILRHASAGEKSAWTEPDELRPLDAEGREQSTALADLLLSYGPARVVSSATARCTDTVLPYVRRIRGDLVTDAAFTVGENAPAVDRLLALADAPTVVCTHGEVVTDLITGLCRALGGKVPEEPALAKAAFWVAHLADTGEGAPAIVSLERHSVD